jgi:hypothetical protein
MGAWRAAEPGSERTKARRGRAPRAAVKQPGLGVTVAARDLPHIVDKFAGTVETLWGPWRSTISTLVGRSSRRWGSSLPA